MTRLLRVEAIRFLSRRAVLVLLALAIVIPVVIGFATVRNTAPPGADELAQAKEQIQQTLDDCAQHPRRYGIKDAADPAATCEKRMHLRVEDYAWYEPLSLGDERKNGSGVAVVVLLGILMLLAGATFAGYDWASGSMSNQLLFETRRLRIWAAKAVVVTAAAAVVSAVVLAAYWLVLARVADHRDITTPPGVLSSCLQSGWRGAAVIGGAALGGYALTMLFRSTVASLGILLAVVAAGGVVLAAVGIESAWNPGLNLLAVVLDGTTYYKDVPCEGGGGTCSTQVPLSLLHGLVFTGTLLVLAVGGSLTSFRTRDVP
ncbi:ABC transporter permease subunit [Nocardioides panacisoli]|uniref:ABC transporter permease n=1 Tax=Nocardioides panacisoli TaxID=627624 RepID=A0ABP7I793_9ACTN